MNSASDSFLPSHGGSGCHTTMPGSHLLRANLGGCKYPKLLALSPGKEGSTSPQAVLQWGNKNCKNEIQEEWAENQHYLLHTFENDRVEESLEDARPWNALISCKLYVTHTHMHSCMCIVTSNKEQKFINCFSK